MTKVTSDRAELWLVLVHDIYKHTHNKTDTFSRNRPKIDNIIHLLFLGYDKNNFDTF